MRMLWASVHQAEYKDKIQALPSQGSEGEEGVNSRCRGQVINVKAESQYGELRERRKA